MCDMVGSFLEKKIWPGVPPCQVVELFFLGVIDHRYVRKRGRAVACSGELGTCYSWSMSMGSAGGLDGVTLWVFSGSEVGLSVGSSV